MSTSEQQEQPARQVLLCASPEQAARLAPLFGQLDVRFANGEWPLLAGRKIVCMGPLPDIAAQHVSGYTELPAELPDDISTPEAAWSWAMSNRKKHPATQVGGGEPPPSPPPLDSRLRAAKAAPAQSLAAPAAPALAGPLLADDELPPLDTYDERMAAVEERSQAWIPSEAQTWPVPANFWAAITLPDVDFGCLPPSLAGYARDQAELIGGDPAQMLINVPVLCAAAIREQIGLQMEPHNERWVERARLWGAVVGSASVKKGPMMDAVTRHFIVKDNEIRKSGEDALKRYALAEKQYLHLEATYIKESTKNLSAVAPMPPEKPLSERMWTEDITLQALGKLLAHHARGKLLVLKQELSSWFGSFDAYTGADMDRPAYLASYDGGPRWIDRSDGSRAFYVPSFSCGVLGGIQPSVATKWANRGMSEDGMFARFMICVAKPANLPIKRPPDQNAVINWVRTIDNLIQMQPRPDGHVRFSPEAQEFQTTVGAWVHRAMRSGVGDAVCSALGKFEGLHGRIALTLHCAESAAFNEPIPRAQVSLDIASQAWELMRDVLWPHLLHFYSFALGGNEDSDSIKLANFILARLGDNRSEVSRGILTTTEMTNWGHLRTMRGEDRSGRRTQNMLDQMVLSGWLSPVMNSGAGSKYKFSRYAINPRLRSMYEDKASDAIAERERYVALMHGKNFGRKREPGED